MNLDKLQRRAIDDNVEINADDNIRTVSGYALKFNTLSCDLGGYLETIAPEALDNDILSNSDIFAFINHDEKLGVLARSRFGKGKLLLSIDNIGLKYEFKVSDKSPCHQQLMQYLDDEIITKSSFSFTVADYEWVNNEDGTEYVDADGLQRLIIRKFDRLFDVSPVFEPAYFDTSSEIRKANEVNNDIINEMNQRKQNKLDNYYKKIRKKYRLK